MGDHVVQLVGDAGAFGRQGGVGQRVPVTGELRLPVPQARGQAPAVAGEPRGGQGQARHHEQEQDIDQVNTPHDGNVSRPSERGVPSRGTSHPPGRGAAPVTNATTC
nr:hypothetical protein GCM10020093_112370 [Planobispora longispora]